MTDKAQKAKEYLMTFFPVAYSVGYRIMGDIEQTRYFIVVQTFEEKSDTITVPLHNTHDTEEEAWTKAAEWWVENGGKFTNKTHKE